MLLSSLKKRQRKEIRKVNLNDLEVGDIILVGGDSPLGVIIKYATKGDYTHSGCYLGNGYMIEASWGGVQISPITKYYDYKHYDVYRHPKATREQLWEATFWMREQLYKGYDYLGLLGIGAALLFRKDQNRLDNKNRYWCSELIADGYLKAGISLEVPRETWKVSPNDLSRLLTKV